MIVSVLTPTLPQRRDMLEEAAKSVLKQHAPGHEVEHLIATDHDGEGAGPLLNRMLSVASGDAVMVLDDDDLLDPNHLATVIPALEHFDVAYTLPRVTGGTFTQYEEPFDARKLAAGHNVVSHTALMRADMVRQVGGWSPIRMFDLDLFCRLEAAGAEFRQIRSVTWTYRLHGANWSQGTLQGAPA